MPLEYFRHHNSWKYSQFFLIFIHIIVYYMKGQKNQSVDVELHAMTRKIKRRYQGVTLLVWNTLYFFWSVVITLLYSWFRNVWLHMYVSANKVSGKIKRYVTLLLLKEATLLGHVIMTMSFFLFQVLLIKLGCFPSLCASTWRSRDFRHCFQYAYSRVPRKKRKF